jgi:ubiquinone/menaquinone biosynthesis C-methylase UbiE
MPHAQTSQMYRIVNQLFACASFVLPGLMMLVMTTGIAIGQDDDAPRNRREQLNREQQQKRESRNAQNGKIPRPLTKYMGREIAQTMHYSGAEWLIRNEREREERCSLMLANLGVEPKMTICDMGCGNGFYTVQLAKMVGEDGTVLAVDVQPEMLSLLRENIDDQRIENVTPILGSFHNPRLPQEQVDMVLMVDVYHEFSHPEQMLKAIRESLKPNGVIVLVEFRAEDPDVPIKPEHKMTKVQVEREMTANGFKFVKEYDKLPWQHMLFYGRDDSANPSEHGDESSDNAGQYKTDSDSSKSGVSTLAADK